MSLQYFTPKSGFIGGSIIGLSAGNLLLFNGDILGASGIASSFAVAPKKTLAEQPWKLSFVAAFALTTRLYVAYVDPDAWKEERRDLPVISPLGYAVGGFLVGFGTKLGNGCTSGHGVCGMARLSKRSWVAVPTFVTTGILSSTACSSVSFIKNYLRDTIENVGKYERNNITLTLGTIIASLAAGATLPGLLLSPLKSATKEEVEEHANNRKKIIPSVVSAALFSIGLAISKLNLPSKINGFLYVKNMKARTWDPTLIVAMSGGIFVSFLSYQFVKGFGVVKNSNALECPLKQENGKFNVPTNKIVDKNLVLGEAIFGLGWGVAGLCPGPAMFLAFAGFPNILLRWWPGFFVGSIVAEKVKQGQISKKDCSGK